MNGVTEKTNDLVMRWCRANAQLNRLKREINSAECELSNASTELGNWLVPEGQNEESFNIWFGSGIIQSTRYPNGNYEIKWRKEPDGKDRLEFGL